MKKKKIVNFVVDLLLIAIAFSVTDFVLLNLFETENGLLELGIYLVCYALLFGAKKGVEILYLRLKQNKDSEK